MRLAELDLRPAPALGTQLTFRLATAEREALDAAAEKLGVPPSRIVRALLRAALRDRVIPTPTVGRPTATR